MAHTTDTFVLNSTNKKYMIKITAMCSRRCGEYIDYCPHKLSRSSCNLHDFFEGLVEAMLELCI